MSDCDCCGQKVFKKVARRPNYQKLVDCKLPQYGVVLGNRLNEESNQYKTTIGCDGRTIHKREPCIAIVPIERGAKHDDPQMAIPMPCTKFAQKCCDKPDCPGVEKKKSASKITVCMPDDPSLIPQGRTRDYMYRCESRELLGSKMLRYCECVKRNGLQDECPRTPCKGRPACRVKPWPNCWPSGGCYGIDYDRLTGVQRFNPALQYRRDNKRCGPGVDTSDDVKIVLQP